MQICPTQQVWVEERNNQLCIDSSAYSRNSSAQEKKVNLKLVDWREESVTLSDIRRESVVIASPDIGMREAIALKQHSGLPILLVENNELIGVLDDSDFYAGLLGKHHHNAA